MSTSCSRARHIEKSDKYLYGAAEGKLLHRSGILLDQPIGLTTQPIASPHRLPTQDRTTTATITPTTSRHSDMLEHNGCLEIYKKF